MSRTNKHQKMHKIKSEIKELKENENYDTGKLKKLIQNFNSPRYGNKRKSVALSKVLERRKERKILNENVEKEKDQC